MVLFVGTKLQLIVTSLVLRARTEASDKDDLCGSAEDEDRGVKTCPGISPRDDLFWFKSPRLLLFLVHFILFQVFPRPEFLVFLEIFRHKLRSTSLRLITSTSV